MTVSSNTKKGAKGAKVEDVAEVVLTTEESTEVAVAPIETVEAQTEEEVAVEEIVTAVAPPQEKIVKIQWLENTSANVAGIPYEGKRNDTASVPEGVAYILSSSRKAVIIK